MVQTLIDTLYNYVFIFIIYVFLLFFNTIMFFQQIFRQANC